MGSLPGRCFEGEAQLPSGDQGSKGDPDYESDPPGLHVPLEDSPHSPPHDSADAKRPTGDCQFRQRRRGQKSACIRTSKCHCPLGIRMGQSPRVAWSPPVDASIGWKRKGEPVAIGRDGCLRFLVGLETGVFNRCASMVSAIAMERAAIDEAWEWLAEKGAEASAVRVATINGASGPFRGLVAARQAQKGEVLARVPKSLCLTPANSKMSDEANGMREGLALVRALLNERQLGSQSLWAPYLRLIGDPPPLPVEWKESDIELLQGTEASEPVKAEREALRRDFSSELLPTVRAEFNEFVRAVETVWSRCWSARGGPNEGLIPVVDMCNHSSEPTCHVSGVSTPSRAHKEVADGEGSDRVALVASCPLEEGNEVTIRYAEGLGNAELLLRFGFCEKGNPSTFVRLREEDMEEAIESEEPGLVGQCLASLGIAPAELGIFAGGHVPERVIRLACLVRKRAEGGVEEGQGDEWDEGGLALLADCLSNRLEEMPEGRASEDRERAEEGAGRDAPSFVGTDAALYLRSQEKDALEKAFAWAVSQAASLRSRAHQAPGRKRKR